MTVLLRQKIMTKHLYNNDDNDVEVIIQMFVCRLRQQQVASHSAVLRTSQPGEGKNVVPQP